MDEEYLIPVVSVVGGDGRGSGALLEALSRELSSRGKRVGVVKRAGLAEVKSDTVDARRLCDEGAAVVAVSSGDALAVLQPAGKELSLFEIVDQYFTMCDIVLTEGVTKKYVGRVRVLSEGEGAGDVAIDDELIAVAADFDVKIDAPVVGPGGAAAIADLIEERYFKNVSRSDLRLWADGKFVVIKPFVKAFIGQAVKGMLSSLRGGKNAEKIHIKIGR